MNNTLVKLDIHPAIDDIREQLNEIEEYVSKYSLADAIREGCHNTEQAKDWEQDGKVCAMSAAYLAMRARGLA